MHITYIYIFGYTNHCLHIYTHIYVYTYRPSACTPVSMQMHVSTFRIPCIFICFTYVDVHWQSI